MCEDGLAIWGITDETDVSANSVSSHLIEGRVMVGRVVDCCRLLSLYPCSIVNSNRPSGDEKRAKWLEEIPRTFKVTCIVFIVFVDQDVIPFLPVPLFLRRIVNVEEQWYSVICALTQELFSVLCVIVKPLIGFFEVIQERRVSGVSRGHIRC